MKEEKPKLMLVTNPDEIAAVRRGILGQLDQPIGCITINACWAYRWSVERWRDFNRLPANKEGVT